MDHFIKLFVAFGTPLIWLLYFREREGFGTPARAVWLAVLCGVLVTYPAWLLQKFLRTSPEISFRWFHDLGLIRALTMDGTYAQEAVRGIVYGGVIEEGLKLLTALALFLFLRRSLRPWHLPVIVLALGCGFAMVENTILYLNVAAWQQSALVRGFSGSHVFYGVIMGSFLALGFMRRGSVVLFLLALIVPILLHGAYNHALTLNSAGGEAGVLARIAFLAVVLFSGLLALGLSHYVARLAETETGNAVDDTKPPHPWMRRARWREWTWLFLAMFSGVVALAFLTILRGQGAILEFKATLVLAVLATFDAILFGLRSRKAAKEI